MKRKLKTGLVLAFIAGLLVLFAHPDYRQGEPSLRGRAARDFPFTPDGKPANFPFSPDGKHLSDFRGKVVLLNFWATWCPPCVDEVASLNALQQRIAPLGGTVLGVNVGINDEQSAYEKFLADHRIVFPAYRDATEKLAATYGTMAYPETYVIDRQGRLDRKIVGPQDWTSPEMMAYLNSVLDEK